MSDIIVYGRGKTGNSLIKMLQKQHIDAIQYDDSLGFDNDCDLASNNVVLVSPGVPPFAKGLVSARKRGAKILGELEYCFPFCKGRCISVTGTNGKTTTCEMIYEILKDNGVKTRLLGNGGVPFSSQVLDVGSDEIVVLESSSFQLADCRNFAPYVSVFTNLAPDHLNYHGSFEAYALAKQNNFLHQKEGFAIFNLDDANVMALSKNCKCAKLFFSVRDSDADCYYSERQLTVNVDGNRRSFDATPIAGFAKHNLSNAISAILACACVEVDPAVAIRALSDYRPLPHRLQYVDTICGVTFINDSKATNVHATVSALQCFAGDLALILGGSDKGERYDEIFDKMGSNVRLVVAVGQTAHAIAECGKTHGVYIRLCDSLDIAVKLCYEAMKPLNGIVLMSNACASFDEFCGFEERGNYFIKAVEKIKSDEQKN